MPRWKTWFRQASQGTAATATFLVLLGWGTYALQWTAPSNDLQTVTHSQWSSYTFQYRIPPGKEQDYRLRPEYPSQAPNPSYINTIINDSNILGYVDYRLRLPISTPWSSTVNYIVMSYSPNQTYHDIDQLVYREMVWFTGPQGNLTGVMHNAGISYFEITSPANYTIHIFNPTPPQAYLNATGTATLSASTVEYTHPYYNSGLLTIGVAGAFATVFSAFTAYELLKHKQKQPA